MLRFAPSPTGDMHIGDLRVAIINYLVSQQKSEQFIIRIEDRNKEQNIEGKDTEIMQILEKFALKHESVFHQSEHLHMHQTLAIKLLEEKKAFICTCPSKNTECKDDCSNKNIEKLSKLKESNTPFVIRIKQPLSNIIYRDAIQGELITHPNEIGSFIILNENSVPTYNFACACDDMLSGVNLIIREEKYLLDTPKQIYIKKQLGYEEETSYAHLASILNANDDDTFLVKWFFKEGYTPDAIINYLLIMGNSKIPQEIFTLPQAIKWFNIENISKDKTKFDLEKLRFINAQHIKMMDNKQLSTLFDFADEDIGKLAKLYLQEVSTVKELKEKIESIFSPKDFSGKWGTEMRTIESIIQNAPMINSYDEFKAYIEKKSGLNGEKLMKPLTRLLTGNENSPELSGIYPLIKSYILEVAS
jgi:glutamyl-tRNA synthetase